MKKYCFIYNPSSNRKRSERKYHHLKELVTDWKDTTLLKSAQKGDIEILSREASKHFETVVACGGDGTVHETVNGMVHSGARLGVIPIGSGNDFAKELGIPDSIPGALNILEKGASRFIDLCTVNGHYFANTLGFGFDGLANFYASTSSLPGHIRYVWAALKANVASDIIQVKVVSGDWEREKRSLMLTFANGRVEGGNFMVAPEAKLDDGLMDVVLVTPVSKYVVPFLIPFFLFGKQHLLSAVETLRCRKAVVAFQNKVPIHADGEVLESEKLEFRIEVVERCLEVVGDF